MQQADLAYGTGPVVSSLDKVLSKFHVQRQAYHGKAFVGNHVHRCCTVSPKSPVPMRACTLQLGSLTFTVHNVLVTLNASLCDLLHGVLLF